ncbi:protein LIFEGUARD 3-like [Nymphaea colorata]|nr:protein LIFEGUARD 3-like [Nymphaea colorata]
MSTYLKDGDVEEGAAASLYPMMTENPELRWAFIRKIYAILTVQLLLTVAVCAVVVALHPTADFLVSTNLGRFLFNASLVMPFAILIPMYIFRQMHPVNFVFLGLYTLSISFLVGFACALTNGRAVLEAASVTVVLFLSLTLYTYWAARRGHDFQFLRPFLFSSLTTLIFFGFLQLFFPFSGIASMIYSIIGIIIFSGYVIYDTDDLIKRYSYDEYIWASCRLYLDIINLFLLLLRLFGSNRE